MIENKTRIWEPVDANENSSVHLEKEIHEGEDLSYQIRTLGVYFEKKKNNTNTKP